MAISSASISALSSAENVDRTTRRCLLHRYSMSWHRPSGDAGLFGMSLVRTTQQPRSASPDPSSGIALKAASLQQTKRMGPLRRSYQMPILCLLAYLTTRFNRLQSIIRGLLARRCSAWTYTARSARVRIIQATPPSTLMYSPANTSFAKSSSCRSTKSSVEMALIVAEYPV